MINHTPRCQDPVTDQRLQSIHRHTGIEINYINLSTGHSVIESVRPVDACLFFIKDLSFKVAAVLSTRMHSSRMRTVRSSGRLMKGMSFYEGCLPRGCLSWGGGVCLGERVSAQRRGVDPREEVSAQGVYTSRLLTESQTGVKTLPFHNFVCGR